MPAGIYNWVSRQVLIVISRQHIFKHAIMYHFQQPPLDKEASQTFFLLILVTKGQYVGAVMSDLYSRTLL